MITRRRFLGAALAAVPAALVGLAGTRIEPTHPPVLVYQDVKHPGQAPGDWWRKPAPLPYRCGDTGCLREQDHVISDLTYVAVHVSASLLPTEFGYGVTNPPLTYEWMAWDYARGQDTKALADEWFAKIHGAA